MTSAFKKYISVLARVCRDETFHGEYDLAFEWMKQPCEKDNSHSRVYVSIKSDPVYLWATLCIYPALFESYEAGNYKGCGQDILHEMCHLFIEPVAKLLMRDCAPSQETHFIDTIERQTQRICNALFDALPEDWYTPYALGVED